MGNHSYLRGTRNNADRCEINWGAMDPTIISKQYILDRCLQSPAETRPRTVQELASRLHGSKLCGYITGGTYKALQELSRNLKPYGGQPRIFFDMELMCQLWCFEFAPGTDRVRIGIYDYLEKMNRAMKVGGEDALMTQYDFEDQVVPQFMNEVEGWDWIV